MRIKSEKKKNLNFLNFYKYYFFFSILVLALVIVAFSQLSFWDKYKEEAIKRIHLNGMYNYVHLPKILYLVGSNIFNNIEKNIRLDINQENLIIIENNRKQKIENSNTPWIEINGKLSLGEQTVSTDIRLKGDRAFHYESKDKSSYKFNLKGDNIFDGLKSFSIQKPRARNYINEWIFHKFAKELDIIHLKYEFVKFSLNGDSLGLYVIEESFSNNLLEKNNRRSGPIFGLEESFSALDIDNIKLDPYQINYWSRPENQNVLLNAKTKLIDFFNNKIKVNEVLDIEKWSDYLAMCDLLMTHHGVLAKSVKFYYNPISGLFEPIAFDGHKSPAYNYSSVLGDLYDQRTSFLRAISNNSSLYYDENSSKFLKLFFFNNDGSLNEEFFENYNKSLNKIINIEFLDKFFLKYEKEINVINSKIYLDDFQFDYNTERKKGLGIYYFDKKEIYNRVKAISEINYIDLKKVSFEDFDDKILINNLLYNNNQLKITEIKCGNNGANLNISLKKGKFQIYKNKHNLEGIKCQSIYLRKVNGKTFHEKISQNLFKKNISLKRNYEDYFNINDKILTPKSNILEFNENIFIPANFTIKLNSNNKLILKDNAFIFSESNWEVIGEKDNPVIITGSNENFGGGIFINSKNKNKLKNVIFSNLAGPDIYNRLENGFIITQKSINDLHQFSNKFIKNINYKNDLSNLIIYGAVNFYKSKVEIENVKFINISSEDSINIFKSDFKLKNSIFENIGSDAVDIDFSNGKISNLNFKNISNDALDFSGSKVNIENITFTNVGDKAISSGENSEINIDRLIGQNSFIGIANKDGSKISAKNIKFNFIQIPLASYIKKEIYNGGEMKISNYNSKNSNSDYLLTETTKLIIESFNKKPNIDRNTILKIIYKN